MVGGSGGGGADECGNVWMAGVGEEDRENVGTERASRAGEDLKFSALYSEFCSTEREGRVLTIVDLLESRREVVGIAGRLGKEPCSWTRSSMSWVSSSLGVWRPRRMLRRYLERLIG